MLAKQGFGMADSPVWRRFDASLYRKNFDEAEHKHNGSAYSGRGGDVRHAEKVPPHVHVHQAPVMQQADERNGSGARKHGGHGQREEKSPVRARNDSMDNSPKRNKANEGDHGNGKGDGVAGEEYPRLEFGRCERD